MNSSSGELSCFNFFTILLLRDPITNRAGPDSPKVPLSGPIQIYQQGFELSIHLKDVDGSSRQPYDTQ